MTSTRATSAAKPEGEDDRGEREPIPDEDVQVLAAQALALVPGISRSGISISAGLFAGLDREAAARFAFLMATPITAGAGLWELRKILSGEAGVELPLVPLLAGMAASLVAGLLAIAVLMRYLRTNGVGIFVAYRIALAALVVVAWLGLWDR